MEEILPKESLKSIWVQKAFLQMNKKGKLAFYKPTTNCNCMMFEFEDFLLTLCDLKETYDRKKKGIKKCLGK